MAYTKFLLVILFFATTETFNFGFNTRSSTWPFNNILPFPYPTYGPIGIETSKAKVISILPPVLNTIGTSEKVVVQNIGNSVIISLNQTTTSSTITGGPLFANIYKFSYIRLFWNNNYKERALYTIDDNFKPSFVPVIVFHKAEYGSLENSHKHRDGVVLLTPLVSVEGHVPNPGFAALEKKLKKVPQFGQFEYGICGELAAWLEYSSPFYYTFPTSSVDKKGKYYNDATAIVVPFFKTTWISIDQFAVFLSLRNSQNSPINATLPSFIPSDDLPIIQGSTLKQILKPI